MFASLRIPKASDDPGGDNIFINGQTFKRWELYAGVLVSGVWVYIDEDANELRISLEEADEEPTANPK